MLPFPQFPPRARGHWMTGSDNRVCRIGNDRVNARPFQNVQHFFCWFLPDSQRSAAGSNATLSNQKGDGSR